MLEKEMVFLGVFNGVSKKTGKSFHMAYFYAPNDNNGAYGYQPYSFFVNDEVASSFSAADLLKKFVVNFVFANGQNVYVCSKKA